MTLHEILREKLKLSDAEFGASCSPPISRKQIWCYRTGRGSPDAPQAVAVLEALKRRGVVLELRDLLAKPRRRRKAA